MKSTVYVSVIVVAVLFLSCGKSMNSKPQLSIQSINTLIPYDGELDVTLKFVDKSGSLGGGTFTAVYVPTNTLAAPPGDSLPKIFEDSIPDFPSSTTGQLQFTLPANSFHEQIFRNDTLLMKFIVLDQAGNMSDTVTSPMIVALYQ